MNTIFSALFSAKRLAFAALGLSFMFAGGCASKEAAPETPAFAASEPVHEAPPEPPAKKKRNNWEK